MGISLQKGQAISLDKTGNKFELRCSWDKALGKDMDLDIMALLCDQNERAIPGNDCLVFYNNLQSKDGSIIHTGDERTGSKDGWDEILKIDFTKMSDGVNNVFLLLNIHEALSRGQNFGLVRNLKMELYDIENNIVVAEFMPDLDNCSDTCLVLGSFILRKGKPYFKAIALGHQKGLDVILREYGVDVE